MKLDERPQGSADSALRYRLLHNNSQLKIVYFPGGLEFCEVLVLALALA